MSAIGKGDWVECIQNRLPTTAPPRGLVVGRAYRVTATGATPPDDSCPNTPWVRLAGVSERPTTWGFRAEWFRPIYRPKGKQLLRDLLQPVREDA